jgi:hypothetical protein
LADNVAVTPGAGATFAADDVGGILHPRVKISIGADGTAADWPVGSGNQSAVPRVTLATDSPGVITTGTAGTPSSVVLTVQGVTSMTPLLATTTNTALTDFGAGEYETVAAGQTDQILGATGAVGDYLAGLLITPTTTGAGSVSIKDGNGSSIAIFNTGTLSNLVPFFVPLGIKCVNSTTPGWKVTTGTNVTVVGVGNFT